MTEDPPRVDVKAVGRSLKLSSRRRGPQVPPLLLREADLSDSTTGPSSIPVISDCGVCLKRIPTNPELCGDCQIWNDPNHVFQCLRDPDGYGAPIILGDALSRANCMICQIVAKSILERFQSTNQSVINKLLKTEITISGPYCLGEAVLRTLDPSFSSILENIESKMMTSGFRLLITEIYRKALEPLGLLYRLFFIWLSQHLKSLNYNSRFPNSMPTRSQLQGSHLSLSAASIDYRRQHNLGYCHRQLGCSSLFIIAAL